MKRIIKYTILLVCVIQIKTFNATAQIMNNTEILNSPLYREKLHMFTDRSLYSAGENVLFRLYNLSHPLLKDLELEELFYGERMLW